MDDIRKQEIIDIIRHIGDDMSLRDIYRLCPYSATKLVAVMHEPFIAEEVAAKTYAAHYNDESSEYYHMSIEEIIQEWEKRAVEGRTNGKILDTYIGITFGEHNGEPETEKQALLESSGDIPRNKCRSFDKFFDNAIKGKLDFVARERTMYDTDKKLNGRFDAIFMRGDKLFVVDWKNSKSIKISNPYEKLKGPLSKYDNCDLNCYTMQLYLYIYMLRKRYGITDIDIVPLIVRIGEEDYGIYRPVIPYSDSLMEEVIDFATMRINTDGTIPFGSVSKL